VKFPLLKDDEIKVIRMHETLQNYINHLRSQVMKLRHQYWDYLMKISHTVENTWIWQVKDL